MKQYTSQHLELKKIRNSVHFVDANCARYEQDHRLHTVGVLKLVEAAIVWQANKQTPLSSRVGSSLHYNI